MPPADLPAGPVGLPELTSRESDILSSMAQGHSIRRTARALGIAPKTVENVQTRLFRKLGVRNRSGALAVADAFGLLPPAPAPASLITRPALKPLPGLSSDMARHLAAGSCAISDEKPDRRTWLA
jgi:DNA-binding CsgD family transcriptional regulator